MPERHEHRPEGRSPSSRVRAERDRFVAFAFCNADILLELDSHYVVTYAGGATVALTGRPSGGLLGLPIFDLVPESDRDVLRKLLNRAANGQRLEQAVCLALWECRNCW